MKKKILIIGGSSYIATNFYRKYKNNFSIRLLTRKKFQDNNMISVNNYFNKQTLTKYIKNCEVVILTAGIAHKKNYDEHEMYLSNTYLPILVFKICNKLKVNKFIFLSTASIYKQKLFGHNMYTNHPNPNNFYSWSKLQAEKKLKNTQDIS